MKTLILILDSQIFPWEVSFFISTLSKLTLAEVWSLRLRFLKKKPPKFVESRLYYSRWNESFLNDKDDSGEESSAKVLFKQLSTTFV